MITHWVLQACASMINWVIDLIPDSFNPPGFVQGAADSVAGFFNAAASLTVWIPLDLAFLAAHAIMSTYIGGGLVKAARILISHFTGGGGSAA